MSLDSVDRNLQAIKAVEGAWSLPPIPDEVKIDLAGNPSMTPSGASSLLTGIAADLEAAGQPEPLPTRDDYGVEEPVNPSYGYKPQSRTQAGLFIAGAAGLETPQVYSSGAHRNLKQRLADEGYLSLSPEEIESDRWLPEYSYAARQMNFDEMTRRFQGEKPGSVSVNQIMGFVDEWLSPRGLYRAAVELDLWWDAGQISEEFKSWDEKWQTVREDPTSPRAWIDALTGPLDDLLFPALNIALMFVGIGEVMAVGRGVAGGVKGAQALAGIYRGGEGVGFAAKLAGRGLDDIARFAQPSFIARKLPEASKAARTMEAWRKNGAVILAKKANQQLMRAGFASNVEQLIDSDRGGRSLNRFTGVGEQVYDAFTNPMLDWGVDLLFMPTNIWNPGTFSKPARAAKEAVQNGFMRAADNQDLLLAWDAPVQAYLAENVSETAAKEYRKLTSKVGMKRAMSETFFEGNDELMGAALAYTTTMAAVEHKARQVSDLINGGPLHELNSSARRTFHSVRNQIIGRLRQLNPENVEDMITHIAKYGDDPNKVIVKGARNARQFNSKYRKVQDAYLESAEAAAARGAAVPDGHTRFVGQRNVETGQIEWRASTDFAPEGDPFFVDLHTDELRQFYGDELGDVLSGERNLDDMFAHRYLRRDETGTLRHRRLGEAGSVRLYDPEKLEALKGVARRHNELRNQFLVEMMDEITPEAVSQYVYEVMPTFGRMGQFTESSDEILKALSMGQLDNVRFVSPMSEANRRLAQMPWTPGEDNWSNEMFQMMLELPDDEKLAGNLMESVFSPFARDVDPQMGTFTAANLDTVTKQEALAFGATARRTTKMIKALRRIRALPESKGILNVTSQYVGDADTVTRAGLREVLAEAFGNTAVSERTIEDLAALGRIADDAGVTLDDVEQVLMKKLADINADARWAERYMVPTQMDQVDDLVREVDAKIKEIERQAYFMASEVEGAPEWLRTFLADRQYKLVYGVEFAQPMDLDKIMPPFADATRRHVRQKRLGNFFSRQDPAYVSAMKSRKVREGVVARLANLDDAGDGARPLNLGKYPDPSNADQNEVMNDLWDILTEVQEEARNTLDSLPSRGFVGRVAGRASLARIPFSLDRLASDLTFDNFVARVIGRGYSKKQAIAMYHGLQSSQALGVQMHGLYAIESKLRSEPNLINGLRLLGTVAEGDKYRKGRAILGGIAGGYVGNVAASEMGIEEGSGGQLLAAGGGMLLGGALGAQRGIGIPGVRSAADALENSKFAKWSYVADWVGNVRDMVRFSLSPVFDASRYSEAIILGQIGDLPDGLRNLRVNQSPSAFRRQVARELRKSGADSVEAGRQAETVWHRYVDEFAASARGYKDFDWEVIDGVGRRFSSVGILGFSPTDWMASTFAHLRRGGVDQAKAYEIVRDIYTYGTTGRSAAELSMNFVFFPFSFTKKTVGHFAKFFSDDLARLIVLQDSLAAYQMLDEEYDLSQEWKDRLPVLQKMHRLNLLAYGVGLGQYGGVNAPIIEGAIGGIQQLPGAEGITDIVPGAPEVVNAFIPQMIPMNATEDANTAWDSLRGMMPVINDVNTLIGMAVEQGRVVGSEQHLTAQAQTRRAWDEWRAFQQEVEAILEQTDMTWDQAVRRPEINMMIQNEKTRISNKYPEWKQGLGDGIAHQQAVEMELRERIQFPQEPADQQLIQFQQYVDTIEDAAGMTFTGSPERMPPEAFRLFRQFAIELSQQNSSFLKLYNRFYRRTLGDITEDVMA